MKKTIQYEGNSIAYCIQGTGPTIVLLHGFMESKAIWEDFSEELKQDFRVISIDLPGHGESETISEMHSMALMAEAVREVLKIEEVDTCIMVGHSMGGYVSLQFGHDNPGLLNGLILFHSHASPDSDETKANRQRMIKIVNNNRGHFIQVFIPDLFDQKNVDKYAKDISILQEIALGMTPQAIVAALKGMSDRKSHLAFLETTEIPVLFILGKNDDRMPYKQILEQAILAPHSEILLLDNVGHEGFIEAKDKTLSAVKHFAKRFSA